ncbi:MAG TPA: cell division protein FtsZ, partial [Propionibacterium sp.]|nr:cell division protein FtsZ [Propionibacterium sp.]
AQQAPEREPAQQAPVEREPVQQAPAQHQRPAPRPEPMGDDELDVPDFLK